MRTSPSWRRSVALVTRRRPRRAYVELDVTRQITATATPLHSPNRLCAMPSAPVSGRADRRTKALLTARFLWFAVRHPILVADALLDAGSSEVSF